MFKSRSIVEHLLRGALGFGFLAIALTYSSGPGWWTWVSFAGALACLRGCPMCWTVGLIETVLHLEKGAICADGSCGNVKPPAA